MGLFRAESNGMLGVNDRVEVEANKHGSRLTIAVMSADDFLAGDKIFP